MAIPILLKRSTKSGWEAAEAPILAPGEMGWDKTTNNIRYGNGSGAFPTLNHAGLPPIASASEGFNELRYNPALSDTYWEKDGFIITPILTMSVEEEFDTPDVIGLTLKRGTLADQLFQLNLTDEKWYIGDDMNLQELLTKEIHNSSDVSYPGPHPMYMQAPDTAYQSGVLIWTGTAYELDHDFSLDGGEVTI